MSPLRAPATRPDRRDGGRHGRPDARAASPAGRARPQPLAPETRIRPRLLRTAALPALVAALSGAIAVTFTLHSAVPRPTPALWAVLTVTSALAMAAVAAAALGADRMAASLLGRCAALRRSTERRRADLLAVVESLRRGDGPPPPRPARPAAPRGDEFDLLAADLNRSHEAAVAAVVQASQLSSSVGNEQKLEVFVNLARRLQSLVQREIQLLDELENEVEDPDLLKGLFHVDHLATRIRRHAENLAVLGGAISRRQWSNPVTMTEVLRSAIAEVEQYPRVKLVPPVDGTLRGHAVADVIHLLAELVENASVFSAPHTQVLLRAQYVTAGIAIEVEDRGLGMPAEEQNRMNALLADPDQVNVAHLLQDGRIGLFVVSALARRHGIAVRLQSNIYGGVQAVLVLPQGLLGADSHGLQQSEAAIEAGRRRRTQTAIPAQVAAPPAPAPLPHARPELQALPLGTEQRAEQHSGPHTGQPHRDTHPDQHSREHTEPGAAPDAAQHRVHPTGRHAARPAATPQAPPAVPGGSAGDGTDTAPGADPDRRQPAELPVRRPLGQRAVRQPQWSGPPPHPAEQPHPTAQQHPAQHPAHPTDHSPVPGAARALAPLPVRAEHADRPNPASARPGASHRPRTASPATGPSIPALPIGGAPRGVAERPQLPRRRSQEHIVPQLRIGPPARRGDENAVHDPGLMASFQRGIRLAETASPARPPEAAPAGAAAGRAEPQGHDNTSKE
ncbi:ATP-binding protein [Streptomyces sp. CAU 1734]|uniref:sensor histidine kinase n=1 Tax=Streptomyces sp. CAU 1734 TaxID=3140360 RepID=UPI0032610951